MQRRRVLRVAAVVLLRGRRRVLARRHRGSRVERSGTPAVIVTGRAGRETGRTTGCGTRQTEWTNRWEVEGGSSPVHTGLLWFARGKGSRAIGIGQCLRRASAVCLVQTAAPVPARPLRDGWRQTLHRLLGERQRGWRGGERARRLWAQPGDGWMGTRQEQNERKAEGRAQRGAGGRRRHGCCGKERHWILTRARSCLPDRRQPVVRSDSWMAGSWVVGSGVCRRSCSPYDGRLHRVTIATNHAGCVCMLPRWPFFPRGLPGLPRRLPVSWRARPPHVPCRSPPPPHAPPTARSPPHWSDERPSQSPRALPLCQVPRRAPHRERRPTVQQAAVVVSWSQPPPVPMPQATPVQRYGCVPPSVPPVVCCLAASPPLSAPRPQPPPPRVVAGGQLPNSRPALQTAMSRAL
mmetsp:Transcript_61808/g.134224  ORF Transcript_61808/g.134224 Transcript_61808/m.134224 type:complete len:407 (-) Transcript_61808:821-2041(-)